MNTLAINGGKKVFEQPANLPKWPQIYPETADKIKDIYLGRRWGFYGPCEAEFN